MGQHPVLGQVFDQEQKPLVAARRFDDDLESPELLEEAADFLRLFAPQSFRPGDFAFPCFFHHDTNADSLLVEIDADKLHDKLLVWKRGWFADKPYVYHVFKAVLNGAVSFLIVSPYGLSKRFRLA